MDTFFGAEGVGVGACVNDLSECFPTWGISVLHELLRVIVTVGEVIGSATERRDGLHHKATFVIVDLERSGNVAIGTEIHDDMIVVEFRHF